MAFPLIAWLNLRTASAVIGIDYVRMSLLRLIIIALLLVVWLPTGNACTLAAVFPENFSDCCDQNEATESSCSSCAECATLEKAVAAFPLQPFAPRVLQQREDEWLTRLMLLLSARAEIRLPLIEFCSSPPERPLWQLIVSTALPVRGPSVA